MTADSPTLPSSSAAGAAIRAAPAWKVWTGLWIVYLVWGSTYLAIRVMVETVPPLLGAGARFVVAGAVMLAVLSFGRRVRPTRAQLLSALLVGLLLPGANAVVTVAEQEVPSGVAALLVASIPLWVLLMRRASGEAVSRAGIAAVLVGFVGVALLLRPGEQSGEATVLGLAACVFAAVMWASGSFASPRLRLPGDPLVSTGWQMLLGGLVITAAGLLAGETGDVDVEAFSVRSLIALAYLVVFGSWLAYTAYAWLLQNAPISKVAPYAYVNPVVAIALGWLVLDEVITPVTLIGAAIDRRVGRARGQDRERAAAIAEPSTRGTVRRREAVPVPASYPAGGSSKGRSNSVERTIWVWVRVTPGWSRRRSSDSSRCGGVARADVQHRARLAGHRVGRLDLGVALDRLAHLGGGHPALGVERHEARACPSRSGRGRPARCSRGSRRRPRAGRRAA